MPNIEGQKRWSAVRLLETHELARGGVNGNLNEQAKALADRTEFLMDEKASKAEIVQGVFEFGTYSEFDAAKSTLPLNCTVVINEENTTSTGQWTIGNNLWNGTELKKSSFDPLVQSKKYFDESIEIKNDKELYEASNNVTHININPNNGTIRAVTSAVVNIFKITTGETYELKSTGFDLVYAKLGVSETDISTVGTVLELVPLSSIDTTTKTFVAPISGYAFLNVKWIPSLDITTTLTIKSLINAEVSKIKNIPIRDELAQQRLDAADLENVIKKQSLVVIDPNLFNAAKKITGFYVGVSGTLISNSGAALVCFEIEADKKYLLHAPKFLSTKTIGLSATDSVVNGKAITNRELTATTNPEIYEFITTQADKDLKFAFFTTRLDSQSQNVTASLKIYIDKVPTDLSPYVAEIAGFRISPASTNINNDTPKSRLSNKKVQSYGDSITFGTGGSYIAECSEIWGTTIENYGSSGGRASRVVDIVTAGDGLPKRDTATASKVWPVKDFTDLACVTLMIGTNDSDANITIMGNIDQLPVGKVQDYADPNEYWNLFPNNYVCNIALFIEYIHWKAPEAEIHICTPPYRNQTGVNDEARITKLIPLLESVARLYGVHLFYGTYECGIGHKHMSAEYGVYSNDGVHFTQLGNKVFGKYFAQKVLNWS